MKKLLGISIFISFLLLLPALSHAQSPKDAVRALQKLQARVESGISYRDYAPALGEARLQVNLFLEGTEENKRLADSIGAAMRHYQNAATVWRVKFDKMYLGRLESVSNFIFLDDKRDMELIDLDDFFKEYPKLKHEIKKGPMGPDLHILTAVHTIWDEAATEVDRASGMIR